MSSWHVSATACNNSSNIAFSAQDDVDVVCVGSGTNSTTAPYAPNESPAVPRSEATVLAEPQGQQVLSEASASEQVGGKVSESFRPSELVIGQTDIGQYPITKSLTGILRQPSGYPIIRLPLEVPHKRVQLPVAQMQTVSIKPAFQKTSATLSGQADSAPCIKSECLSVDTITDSASCAKGDCLSAFAEFEIGNLSALEQHVGL